MMHIYRFYVTIKLYCAPVSHCKENPIIKTLLSLLLMKLG